MKGNIETAQQTPLCANTLLLAPNLPSNSSAGGCKKHSPRGVSPSPPGHGVAPFPSLGYHLHQAPLACPAVGAWRCRTKEDKDLSPMFNKECNEKIKLKSHLSREKGEQCCGRIEESDLEFSLQAIIPEDIVPGKEEVKEAAMQRPWGRQECDSFQNTQEGPGPCW